MLLKGRVDHQFLRNSITGKLPNKLISISLLMVKIASVINYLGKVCL